MKVEFYAIVDPEHPDRVYVSTVPPGVERRSALEAAGHRIFCITAELPVGDRPFEQIQAEERPGEQDESFIGKVLLRYQCSERGDFRFVQKPQVTWIGRVTAQTQNGLVAQWRSLLGGGLPQSEIPWMDFFSMRASGEIEVKDGPE